MSRKKFNASFTRIKSNWNREKKSLPLQIAKTAENHFKENFRQGGFINEFLEKWAPRKKADTGRAILVKSGGLKRGIRAVPGYNFQEIRIANDVPYAQAHNEGTKHLPKRQIMGRSVALNLKIKILIRRSLEKVFS
jgi:phage gpG-like protein